MQKTGSSGQSGRMWLLGGRGFLQSFGRQPTRATAKTAVSSRFLGKMLPAGTAAANGFPDLPPYLFNSVRLVITLRHGQSRLPAPTLQAASEQTGTRKGCVGADCIDRSGRVDLGMPKVPKDARLWEQGWSVRCFSSAFSAVPEAQSQCMHVIIKSGTWRSGAARDDSFAVEFAAVAPLGTCFAFPACLYRLMDKP